MQTKLIAAIVAGGCLFGFQASALAQSYVLPRAYTDSNTQFGTPSQQEQVIGTPRYYDQYVGPNKTVRKSHHQPN